MSPEHARAAAEAERVLEYSEPPAATIRTCEQRKAAAHASIKSGRKISRAAAAARAESRHARADSEGGVRKYKVRVWRRKEGFWRSLQEQRSSPSS